MVITMVFKLLSFSVRDTATISTGMNYTWSCFQTGTRSIVNVKWVFSDNVNGYIYISIDVLKIYLFLALTT